MSFLGGLGPLLELHDRDAQLAGLASEVLLNARAREDKNAPTQTRTLWVIHKTRPSQTSTL